MTKEQREQLVREIRAANREIYLGNARLKAEILAVYSGLDSGKRALADNYLNELASHEQFEEALYQGFIDGSVTPEEMERWLSADIDETRRKANAAGIKLPPEGDPEGN